MQQQQQQQQQDVGLARLGALGALADLGDGSDLMNEASTINYEDLNIGNFGQGSSSRQSKSETNRWVSRATELLDLSSGDSRETPNDEFMNQQSNNQQGEKFSQSVALLRNFLVTNYALFSRLDSSNSHESMGPKPGPNDDICLAILSTPMASSATATTSWTCSKYFSK